MPRSSRNNNNSSFFHVIIQGINKIYIFEEEKEIKYYIKSMNLIKEKYNVNIIAYCVMNNHAHMLINVENIQELSKFMQSLNTKYAKYYNKKHDRVGYVFRDRYKSEGIYSEKHLYSCIHYIYNNPVKAKMCEKPEDYPYSNYKEYYYNNIHVSDEYDFIDIDEEKESVNKLIKQYMMKNSFNSINEVINNKENLKRMVYYLKCNKKISYRSMEKELEIGREKLRNLIK